LRQLRGDGAGKAKGHSLGGPRAIVPSSATVERLRELMPLMGITRVANVTGLDRIGIPVVMVCRPNARSLAVSQGKGRDLDSAMASGLMEAAELYHAEHIALPLKLGCQAELQSTHPLIDVSRLPRVAGGRFNPHLVMLWIEGLDLISGESRWIPFESVRANFTLPPPPGSGCFDCSSNGLAAGNTLADAVCHAICEIVERDATALWNRLSRRERAATGVDLASVENAACREALEKLERADFDIAAWETTSDIGVPAFFALISDLRNPANHHGIGAAAHPSRDVALLKALIEAAQVRTTYVSGTRDDLTLEEYGEAGRAAKQRAAKRLLAAHTPERRLHDIPDCRLDSATTELEYLLTRLKAAGIAEAVAVDLSRNELGVAVVRIVIPGLEGPDDHDGYVPGERARQPSGAPH
jgi:YcaO-like protein with predicted kinase domain